MARSLSFISKAFLHPVRRLQSAWAAAVEDGSVEQRLAAALAMRPGMRGRLLPLDRSGGSFGRGDLCVRLPARSRSPSPSLDSRKRLCLPSPARQPLPLRVVKERSSGGDQKGGGGFVLTDAFGKVSLPHPPWTDVLGVPVNG